MSAKKKSYEDKESEEFFREKLEEKLDNLHNMILGRKTPLKDYILTDKGAYSETKTRKLISALMEYIWEYRFINDRDDLADLGYTGQLSLLRVQQDSEKEIEKVLKEREKAIKKYSENLKDKYEAEDVFFENFFYCVIRLLSLNASETYANFSDIAEAAGDLYYVYNDRGALDYEDWYTGSGFRFHSLVEEMMTEDEYDLLPGSSVEERRLYLIKRYLTVGQINIFHEINSLYYVLTRKDTPLDTDITEYKETDPQHFKLLKKREEYLEDEKTAHIERINKYDPPEPSALYPEDLNDDDILFFPDDFDEDDYYNHKYWTDAANHAITDFRKKFKEPDKFIKACELFRYYLNTGKTREFREEHKDDPSVFDLPGYEHYKKKIDYALDAFISDRNLSILSDKDTCVYIYTLLGQAEKMVEKRLGGE